MVDGERAEFSYTLDGCAMRVALPEQVSPGGAITLDMQFDLEVPQSPEGNHGLFCYFEDILALDGFYPAIPVYDDAGWHVGPSPPIGDRTFFDAAFYLVRVTAPSGLVLVASGSEVRRDTKNGEQVVVFAAGPARDFFLAASTRFASVSSIVGETTIISYHFADELVRAGAALAVAEHSVRSFNLRLGYYPYTELDIVPLHMENGAGIEYPGIFGVNTDVYDRDAALESTVAHEVGHQWFYNVVGNDQVNEPWLDESITQYITGLYYLDRHGETGWRDFRQTWISGWNGIGQRTIPIGLPVSSYSGREYVAIIYGRGPLFWETLSERLGGQRFDVCLRRYYESNKWQIVTTPLFQSQFEDCSEADLDELFREWILPVPGVDQGIQ
jgi:aminopeptidase N